MPIDLTRGNVEEKLDQLNGEKRQKIRRQTAELLASHSPAYVWSADEIVARIDVAAHPVMVESVLSRNSNVFSYKEEDEKIYWHVTNEDCERALQVAHP